MLHIDRLVPTFSACSLRRPEALLLESSSHQDSRLDSFYSSFYFGYENLIGFEDV